MTGVSRGAGRGVLIARGAACSSLTTLLAALSHTLGGGAAPAPTIVLAMIVLLVLPAGFLMTPRSLRIGARHRAGIGRIVATTGIAQLAFHGVFTALGGPTAGARVTGGHHHGAVVAPAAPGAIVTHAESPGMLVSHLAAVLVTIAILAYAERAVRGAVLWFRTAVRRLTVRRSVPSAPRILARAAARLRVMAVAALPTGVRGPPLTS